MSLADEILAVLDNPTRMWSHALRELSQEGQRLFLTLPLLPQPILIDDLQVAYTTQHFNKTEPFLDSLRALDDSFVSISAGTRNQRWVDFWNPSLQDFSHEYLNQYTDWLDSLLSSPVYYEQIASVYELAMARRPGNWTLPPRSSGPPYTAAFDEGAQIYSGIHSWVVRQHGVLLPKAIDLALSNSIILNSAQYSRSDHWVALQEIVEMMLAYGDSINQTKEQSFGLLIERALQPPGKSSATTIFALLREPRTAELIERYSVDNPMTVLRSNILDKDIWKFALLSKIDQHLEIDSQESLTAWGNDYVEYVHQVVENLSGETDWWRLDEAIRETEEVAFPLGVGASFCSV